MSITDELREAINGLRVECEEKEGCGVLWYPEPSRDRFSKIADRIDAALVERYVELPEDADGVPIHIGDRVEDNERVARIVLTGGSREPSVYIEKLPNVLHEYFCNEISHYHEPTVEDVLQKLLEQAVGYSDAHTTVALDAIAEYAAKLRLAGEDA